MISKKSKYAFMALIHMAGLPSGKPVLISDLAKDGNIPKKFLEYILLTLRKGGILQSKIGKGGGYFLAVPPNQITIGSIVRILEGDIAPIQCLSTTNHAHCEECQDEATCGIKLTFADVNDALTKVMDGLTIADMVERSENERNKIENVMNYSI
jgi:Rrf2 family protein